MRRILAAGVALATIGLAATKYDGPIPLDPKPRFGKNPLNGSGLIGTRYGGQIPASVKSLRPLFKKRKLPPRRKEGRKIPTRLSLRRIDEQEQPTQLLLAHRVTIRLRRANGDGAIAAH